MAAHTHKSLSALALVVGLGLWTLAPYGGCSCVNPLGANGGPGGGPTEVFGGKEAGINVKEPYLVDDFEDGVGSPNLTGHFLNQLVNGSLKEVWFNGYDPAYRTNLWGGTTYTETDTFGSTYSSDLVQPGADSGTVEQGSPFAPVATGKNSAGCLEIKGVYGRTSNPTPPYGCGAIYPFAQHGLFLSPLGAAGSANVCFNGAGPLAASLAGHGVQFMFKNNSITPAGGTQQTLLVKAILLFLYDYSHAAPCNNGDTFNYHQATVPATAGVGGWSLVQIPFKSFTLGVTLGPTTPGANAVTGGGGANAKTLLNPECWAPVEPANGLLGINFASYNYPSLQLQAIEFDPNTTYTGAGADKSAPSGSNPVPAGELLFPAQQYDFLIDDVEFY